MVYAGRYRWSIAHDEPELNGYDQDRWVCWDAPLGRRSGRAAALFETLRAANLALWRRATPADKARVGFYRERGLESFELSFRLIARHDRIHLGEARRTFDKVRSAVTRVPGSSLPRG